MAEGRRFVVPADPLPDIDPLGELCSIAGEGSLEGKAISEKNTNLPTFRTHRTTDCKSPVTAALHRKGQRFLGTNRSAYYHYQ